MAPYLRGNHGQLIYVPSHAPVGPQPDPHFANVVYVTNMLARNAPDQSSNEWATTAGSAINFSSDGVFPGTTGYIDASVDFSSNQRIVISSVGSSFNIHDANQWTIEAWYRYGTNFSQGTFLGICSLNNSTFSTTPPYELVSVSQTEIEFRYRDQSGSTQFDAEVIYDASLSSQWTHVAVVRQSATVLEIYINGVRMFSTSSATFTSSIPDNPSFGLGILREDTRLGPFRFTKGVARYTSNFTPPSEAFPTMGP